MEAYRQWWETQLDRERAYVPNFPHCDDTVSNGQAVLNGFPLECARPESRLIDTDPFNLGKKVPHSTWDDYVPIAVVNRIDLAPVEEPVNCGEFRIIYALRSGLSGEKEADRNLIIFEGVLPNPDPECGLSACLPVAAYWAELADIEDPAEIGRRLETFFYEGFDKFSPVVDWTHYGRFGGQIRSNQFLKPGALASGAEVGKRHHWNMRQYEVAYTKDRCQTSKAQCEPLFRQVPLTDSIEPELFDPDATSTIAASFRQDFVTQVEYLIDNDVNRMSLNVSDKYFAAEGESQTTSGDGLSFFQNGQSTQFRSEIASELARHQSSLTPGDIVSRATALSCAGCHRHREGDPVGGGVVWPRSNEFTHVTEQFPQNGRYRISPALENVFLPHRKRVLENFLQGNYTSVTLGYPHGAEVTLGGARRVH